jgi:adenylate cyclase
MSFYEELKRRNVAKVAVLYVIASWLLLQVTDVLSSLLPVPEWAGSLVVMLLLLGFFPVMIFSWVYELTPEGLKREKDIDRSQSISPETGRKINVLIIVLLVLAIGAVVVDRLMPETATIAQTPTIEGSDAAPDRSIAVLPFVNMSDDASNEFFSDGISEELLNLLSKIPELRVTSRSSAFAFKGEKIDIPEVAQKLNVAHILEGSVRKAGNRVRITAQLIEARSDTHLWSETYDRTLDDIFVVQDEIAAAVVTQLKMALLGDMPKTLETDPEAFALYLQARQLHRQASVDNLKNAIEMFEDALAIDPNFVPAWNGLSVSYSNLAGRGIPLDEGNAKARAATEQALAIDPDNAWAHTGKGRDARTDGDFLAAAQYYKKALEQEPANTSVLNNSAVMLNLLGRWQEAIPVFEWLAERDPLDAIAFGNLAWAYFFVGRLEEAQAPSDKALALSPGSPTWRRLRVFLFFFWTNEYAKALEACDSLGDVPQLVAVGLICQAYGYPRIGREEEGEAALAMLEQAHAEDFAYDIAWLYALNDQPDSAIEWLEKAYQLDGKRRLGYAWSDWRLESIRDDPRFQALLVKAGVSKEQIMAIEFEVPLPK